MHLERNSTSVKFVARSLTMPAIFVNICSSIQVKIRIFQDVIHVGLILRVYFMHCSKSLNRLAKAENSNKIYKNTRVNVY